MVPNTEKRKSFIGGFLGGFLGYGLGYLFGQVWLSFVLFFIVGYLGYDFHSAIKVVSFTVRQAWKWVYDLAPKSGFEFWHCTVDSIRNTYQKTKVYNPYPILTFVVVPFVVIFIHALCNNSRLAGAGDHFFTTVWNCYVGNWVWYQTGIEPLTGKVYHNTMVSRAFPYFFIHVLALVPAFLVWMGSGWLVFGVIHWAKNIRKTPVYAKVVVFWIFVAPVLLVGKMIAELLIAIHNARRLATAITTLVSGSLILLLVPFQPHLVIGGLCAIACGLTTGVFCLLVAKFLDHQTSVERFKQFVEKSIFNYAPSVN
ncbi:MAG: hypothetical protein UU08_C0037G0001 [Candidatus Uhrbacteria bacterium GW2011_GWE2_40_58]|nr:MAG: hypothetical protein UT94_C0060G0004 [Candidatus Uhrbacteria bacterium GW2011_GWF2_40_263]KKR66638.1 MAG: hypothetical protein UU08_C0037G0001 [Candidatus Uhrbacteria bacterium GW2011_GWE2_40_58]OGL93767.1 MAG: hypothetical protein A2239_02825 [Candidatus Uhrbacteria bacterium RIFOXYA2_FULL_40_9]OGL97635.1 MAG: hypothetical protein A2332_01875 [Candidatus Uhrbacteria bacterium RIFOXYB2_FULL_41_18]HBK34825.1 hypothetical protein [Candidatus Uhrbacteria bacterium]